MTEERKLVNVVLVGSKPVMAYVFSAVNLFEKGFKDVTFKARGMAIKRSIDAVEILRRQFVKDANVAEIKIGTEVAIDKATNQQSNVSFIEIKLVKV